MGIGAVFALWFILFLQHEGVFSHGRLRSPPPRSTMWRYGYDLPINKKDHELNCGGFGNHWGPNKGKCGLCGNNYQNPQPRDNEGGGKYGRGVISEKYLQGGMIESMVEITVNHRGYFEFSLCPHNQPLEPATGTVFVY